jgi:hypothetical protein
MAKRRRASKTDRKRPDKKRRTARQPALPGTESVRSEKLDAICEGIGEERDTMNAAKLEEAALVTAALDLMQKRGITVYRHATIELARVPGAEKLRVRITKEEGDAGEAHLTHEGQAEEHAF